MKKLMCLFLLLTNVSFAQRNQSFAPSRGTEGGGGGDVDAIEFLKLGDDICRWLAMNNADWLVDTQNCPKELNTLRESLNTNTPKVQFVAAEKVEELAGYDKQAYYDRSEGVIFLSRAFWSNASEKEKYVLSGIELAGILGNPDRYGIGILISNNWRKISRKSVSGLSKVEQRILDSIIRGNNVSKDEAENLLKKIIFGSEDIEVKKVQSGVAELNVLVDFNHFQKKNKPNISLSLELFDSSNNKSYILKDALPSKLTFDGIVVDFSIYNWMEFTPDDTMLLNTLSESTCSGYGIAFVIGGGSLSCEESGASLEFMRGGVGINLGGGVTTLKIFKFRR